MKAVVYREYGSPDVIRIEDVPKPSPKDHQVLVRVHATSVGTWDSEARSFSFPAWFWLPLRIAMGIRAPRWRVLGQEMSGVVEAVGNDVTRFKPGDEVFGAVGLGFGAHAQYVCVSSKRAITHKPHNLSHEQAASIPTGGDNALHFLRMAEVQPAERVLVNGAAGNIGVMAVQIAKHYGAEVTAVDSAEKLDALREIGADHVIDYEAEDYTRSGKTYDVIFDLVPKSSYSGAIASLNPKGRYILANPLFNSLMRARWTNWTTDKKVLTRFAASKPKDLVILKELAEAGQVRGTIDRCFPLEEAAEAHAYVDSGRRKGAVILTLGEYAALPPPMRAVTFDRYGSPDVVRVSQIPRPSCGPDDVVIAVRAASVNPYDWHMMTGTPLPMRLQGGLRTPKAQVLGVDVAGVVEEVGANVDQFSAGDEVFGGATGGFAEYASVNVDTLVHKPENLSFEQAAAVPVGALTAAQGLRDHGQIQQGQHVLINGAAGGVGTYAVQLAKHFGARVTAVCSTRNVDMVRGLGADHVIDYTTEDFTATGTTYDLIFDNIGNRKVSEYKRCLTPTGSYVVIGGPKGKVLGPIKQMLKAAVGFKMGSRRATSFIAEHRRDDMELFRDLLASGELKSVIDTVYPLEETAAALRHLETGHARGKIIITP
jgi:NADPH:quinone reductase-like Zn-dependent oxidoreductase